MSELKINGLYNTSKIFQNEELKLLVNNILDNLHVTDIKDVKKSCNIYVVLLGASDGAYLELNIYSDKIIIIRKSNSIIERYDIDSLLSTVHTVIEGRDNGVLIKKDNVEYGIYEDDKDKTITDIVSSRYVLANDVLRNKVFGYSIEDSYDLSNVYIDYFYSGLKYSIDSICSLKNVFESHLVDVLVMDDFSSLDITPNTSYTYLNGRDISPLYNQVNGSAKIERINDLFNGIINKKNVLDIVGIDNDYPLLNGFDYIDRFGIIERENKLIGNSRFQISNEELLERGLILSDALGIDVVEAYKSNEDVVKILKKVK